MLEQVSLLLGELDQGKVVEAAVVVEQARQQRTVDNQVQVQVKLVLE